MLPASNSAISSSVKGWASVLVQIPEAVLPTKSSKMPRTTPPLTPTASLWKCAFVNSNPSTVTVNANPASVRTKAPVPVAGVVTAGFSCSPVNLAVKWVLAKLVEEIRILIKHSSIERLIFCTSLLKKWLKNYGFD